MNKFYTLSLLFLLLISCSPYQKALKSEDMGVKYTAAEEKYNNGKRIYEIDKNGILKTQFVFQEGFRDINYKYSNGKTVRYLWPSDKVWSDTINLNSKYKDSIYAYHVNNSDNLWFIVGKVKNLNLYQKRMDAKWDSLAPQK